VRDGGAFIFFINESRLCKTSDMLRDGLKITMQIFSDPIDADSVLIRNQEKYGNSPMIRNTLQMSLHLLCALRTAHLFPCFFSSFFKN